MSRKKDFYCALGMILIPLTLIALLNPIVYVFLDKKTADQYSIETCYCVNCTIELSYKLSYIESYFVPSLNQTLTIETDSCNDYHIWVNCYYLKSNPIPTFTIGSYQTNGAIAFYILFNVSSIFICFIGVVFLTCSLSV